MKLIVGLIFKMKRVTYNGKTESVYKYETLDIGCHLKNRRGIYIYCPFLTKLRGTTLYILTEENRKIDKEKFDEHNYYVGVLDEKYFFSKYNNFVNAEENIEKQWGNNKYWILDKETSLMRIVDKYYLDEIEKVFAEDKDKSIKNKDNNKIKIENIDSKTKERLCKYGYFLTDKNYSYNPAIGRDNDIENLELALLHPEKSAMIVGPSGVGKTALVEGLAYKIKNGLVPDRLKDIEIVSINISSLLAGTRYRGDFEEKLVDIINILKENKNIVMFIDEIHTVIGVGAGSASNLDAANILKPYLDRGDIKIIGSTTKEEYDNLINDSAFKRRFKKVNVNEPDRDILLIIIKGVIEGLEKEYNIKFNIDEDILNILLDLTNDKHRDYKDKENNPALVLSIIKDIFSISSLYNHEEVLIEDIIKAINSSDRIYKTTRERYIIILQKKYLINKDNKEQTKIRVLKFEQ